MAEWLIQAVSNIPVAWRIIVLSAIPVTELRASIPMALALNVSPLSAFVLGILGNWIPIMPLLIFVEPAFKILALVPFLRPILEKILARTRRKGGPVEKYGPLGLLLFVGIPAPGTGVWTGSILAMLLGIRFVPALLAMSGGVVLAGMIVTLISTGLLRTLSILHKPIYLVPALAVLSIAIGYAWIRKKTGS